MKAILIGLVPWALFTGLFIAGAIFGGWREATDYDPSFDWVAVTAGGVLGLLGLILRVRLR